MHAKPLDKELTTASNTLKELRNAAIIKDFEDETGKKHLDSDYVVRNLSKKYFLSITTIWRIITQTGYYNKKTA